MKEAKKPFRSLQFIPYCKKAISHNSLTILEDQDESEVNKKTELSKEDSVRKEDDINANNLFSEINNNENLSNNLDAVLYKLKTLFSNVQRVSTSKKTLYSTLRTGTTLKTFKTMRKESDEFVKKKREPKKIEDSPKNYEVQKNENRELFFFDFENMKNFTYYFVRNNCEGLSFKPFHRAKGERRRRTEKIKNGFS